MEWNETVRTCRDPFDPKKFSNLSPEILVEWIAPYVCEQTNGEQVFFTIFGALYQGRKSQDGCDSWKFVLVGPIFKFSTETGGKKGESFVVVALEFPEFLGDQRN